MQQLNASMEHSCREITNMFIEKISCPTVSIGPLSFFQGKAAVEAEQAMVDLSLSHKWKHGEESTTKFSPCGFSVNWQQSDPVMELTVGARGIQQGKRPKMEQDYHRLWSRLCHHSLVQAALDCGLEAKPSSTYQEWKQDKGCPVSQTLKQLIFEQGPLAGWIIGQGGDFNLSQDTLCAAEDHLLRCRI